MELHPLTSQSHARNPSSSASTAPNILQRRDRDCVLNSWTCTYCDQLIQGAVFHMHIVTHELLPLETVFLDSKAVNLRTTSAITIALSQTTKTVEKAPKVYHTRLS